MADLEGSIQFAYDLTLSTGPVITGAAFTELSAWRSILRQLDLVGQHTDRYGGFAFGNMSVRDGKSDVFAITASQTSGAPELLPEQLVRVTHCNLERFWVEAEGSEPPSSESLTHAMIYHADPRVHCIFHIHSAEIWQARSLLKLPQTAVDVAYGTASMAKAVANLLIEHQSRPLVFATAGHEDGIFALGHQARDCGGLLVSYLAKSRQFDSSDD